MFRIAYNGRTGIVTYTTAENAERAIYELLEAMYGIDCDDDAWFTEIGRYQVVAAS